MRKRRVHVRHTRRLETDFFFEDRVLKGISSDLSEKGLFIRTRHCLTTGSYIEFIIYMPGGLKAQGSGVVRRAIKSDSPLIKNGMGIELKRCDPNYLQLLRDVIGRELNEPDVPVVDGWKPDGPTPRAEGSLIIACASCGARNRVPESRVQTGPKCGRCRTYLPT